MQQENFTISVYTENNIGLLNRISAIFMRRHINLDSMNASESEINNVFKFTIVVKITENQVKKIVKQIEKQIEVIKAYYHKEDEIIYLQSAIFKVDSKLLFEKQEVQNVIKQHNAALVTVTPEFFVIQKSGSRQEVDALYSQLEPFGLMQFTRSGRITVTKDKMHISSILEKFSKSYAV